MIVAAEMETMTHSSYNQKGKDDGNCKLQWQQQVTKPALATGSSDKDSSNKDSND